MGLPLGSTCVHGVSSTVNGPRCEADGDEMRGRNWKRRMVRWGWKLGRGGWRVVDTFGGHGDWTSAAECLYGYVSRAAGVGLVVFRSHGGGCWDFADWPQCETSACFRGRAASAEPAASDRGISRARRPGEGAPVRTTATSSFDRFLKQQTRALRLPAVPLTAIFRVDRGFFNGIFLLGQWALGASSLGFLLVTFTQIALATVSFGGIQISTIVYR